MSSAILYQGLEYTWTPVSSGVLELTPADTEGGYILLNASAIVNDFLGHLFKRNVVLVFL